jgi:hypothetical protein
MRCKTTKDTPIAESVKLKQMDDDQKSKMQQILAFLDGTQMFFLLISIPFILMVPYTFKNVYNIVEETRINRPDYVGPKWADFLWLFVTLPAIAIGKYLTYLTFNGFYHRNLPIKYQGKIRDHKIEKACENIFKALFFALISVYGYYMVVKQLPYDSPIVGNGSWHNYFIDFPYVPFYPSAMYYCMLNLSYHTESAIQIVINPGNDFFEMFCHHTLTFMIISVAYICNYHNVAVICMLVIDNADTFVGMIRAGIDVLPESITFIIYSTLMISWIYTRLYLFTFDLLVS